MNSSGILKKGLAASAISALAITGVPALSTSASAAVGDDFTVVSTGPALNGGTQGAEVVIRAQDGEINPAFLTVTGTNSDTAGSQNTGTQTVTILNASAPVDDASNSAFEFITVRIAVTTPAPGTTATFRLFEDDVNMGTLDASEARQPVSITTTGPLTNIEITPATQSSPANTASGPYTVTLRDAANRVTQLNAGETITVVPSDGSVTTNESGNVITAAEIADGTDTFTATGATVGTFTIALDSAAYNGEQNNAVLNVVQAATLVNGDVDIVTGSDSADDADDVTDGGTTFVRVDQNTIRFDFASDDAADAGATVTLAVDGNSVTFGGQDMATFTTTLDANGNGSITVTADAASIQVNDSFTVDINGGDGGAVNNNGFDQIIQFQQAAPAVVTGESPRYFCQLDAPCTVTAVVTDQFGNPVTTGEVSAARTGLNNDTAATTQRKPVGSDGTVDFTFTDVNGFNGGIDTVNFAYFTDQFDNTGNPTGSTVIEYSPDGQGNDFVISLEGASTEVPGFNPDDAAVIPLSDTVAQNNDPDGDEDAVITIANGEPEPAEPGNQPNQDVTLSVDNGALILEPGETDLSEGSASVEATLDDNGVLPNGGGTNSYRVVGTTSGLVTLTVTSANRTETAQLTVLAQQDVESARNVTVSGPAEVDADVDQIVYTAVVTDAFGNPVGGVSADFLNVQVTGPGELQDTDAVTNDMGMINLNVDVDEDAEGVITIRVQGVPTANFSATQFGADADRQFANSNTDDGEGLPVSSDVATATTTVLPDEDVDPVDPIRTPIDAVLDGRNTGKRTDKLKVTTTPARVADGARVNLFRINKNDTRVLVESSELNANGIKRFQVADTNGKKKTAYVARVKRTDDSKAVKNTNTKRVR